MKFKEKKMYSSNSYSCIDFQNITDYALIKINLAAN